MYSETIGRLYRSLRWAAVVLVLCLNIPSARPALGAARNAPAATPVRTPTSGTHNSTFWVILRERADLSPAYHITNWQARGRFVMERLRSIADRSQAGPRRWLMQHGVAYRPFWIANVIQVTAGDAARRALAAMPEVEDTVDDIEGRYSIPEPLPGTEEPGVLETEWNIVQIGADQVWSRFSDTGQGIVIGSIDSGVEYTHDALVNQYRGNLGGGVFDHNYNWYDPTRICGPAGSEPCDNVGHGTHTMGTMVGGDGPGPMENDIGVAPGARWITAKGCEDLGCSTSALLAAGQWMLAPTDLNDENPRPDLRPQIVNNSWGSLYSDTFFQSLVQAWVASGMFPVFANGNSGPYCGSVGSPADYPESFGVGATDSSDLIADFSSRGPSTLGPLKPEASAPGVNVRSSVPGNGYDVASGTSMAAPHVAGTVALLWAAAPSLIGNIADTTEILKATALDRIDTSCGGDADGDPNDVYGDGRIDALTAVETAPRVAGTLTGTVLDSSSGLPVARATVTAVRLDDGLTRTATGDSDGVYSLYLPVDPAPGPELYDVTASAFGYIPQTATNVAILQDETTVLDFGLTLAPEHVLSGTVTDDSGAPISGAQVQVLGTPLMLATTDASGFYSFTNVPEGEYDVQASAGRCNQELTKHVSITADTTLDFTLAIRADSFGYRCQLIPMDWVEASEELPLYYDYGSATEELAFPFFLYGQGYETAYISISGNLNFLAPEYFDPYSVSIPDISLPNAAIYPFWQYLVVYPGLAAIKIETLGTAPDRVFVLEYENVYDPYTGATLTFEVKLYERNGDIEFLYQEILGQADGRNATVGIENAKGTDAFQYSYRESSLSPGLAIRFSPPPSELVEGYVTDANDGEPVAEAGVRAYQDGVLIQEAIADDQGFYRLLLPLGTYTLEGAARNYQAESVTLTVDQDDGLVRQDFVLETARAEVTPSALEFVVLAGESRTLPLELSNTGSVTMSWTLSERVAADTDGSRSGTGEWLYKSTGGVEVEVNSSEGITTALAYPSALAWEPAQPAPALNVLIYADDYYHPAPDTYLDQALQRLGIAYVAHYDADWGGLEADLASDSWDLVLVGNENYFPPSSTLQALDAYVRNGGRLVLYSWAVYAYPVDSLWASLGFTYVSNDDDPPDPVYWWNPSHPAFTDPEHVPEFTSLNSGLYYICGQNVEPLEGAEALAGFTPSGPVSQRAAMIVANDNHTVFQGFISGTNEADLDDDGLADAVELWMNLISGVQDGFTSDVPWLFEQPTSGTLAPGERQEVAVTVDTSSLEPGVYAAVLILESNSGREPTIEVPVTLVVSDYQVAVNAGGDAYTDTFGDSWMADQPYSTGSWGYGNSFSRTLSTQQPISGTDDDPLYQTERRNPFDYRFDDVPPGVYEIDLKFAELQGRPPGIRQFDVIIEDTLVLPAHDIAYEVGDDAADDHTFFVPVTDGQINVRLVPRHGSHPVISALRVTHRVDQ